MGGIGSYLVEVFTAFFSLFGGWQNFLRGMVSCIVFGFVAAFIMLWLRRRQEKQKDKKGT